MSKKYMNEFVVVNCATLKVVEEFNGDIRYKDEADAIRGGRAYCEDFNDSWYSEEEMMYFKTVAVENANVIDTNPYTITEVTDEKIYFSNGNVISYYHCADCCEYNYADFSHLDTEAKSYVFRGPLSFEAVDGAGFRFGDSRRKFFVPCYSEQNGYYSSDVDIYLNDEQVLNLECELDT